MAETLVRIGGASRARGDSPGAIEQPLGADCQDFMMDYPVEVAMSPRFATSYGSVIGT